MESQIWFIARCIFTGLFVLSLLAGVYLFKNHERLFEAHPDVPSETNGSRGLRKLQVFAIWAHAVVLTGAFALMLH